MIKEVINPRTMESWNKTIEGAKNLFFSKNRDYGSSWLSLRDKSLTDQVYIKTQRIITIQENKGQRVTGKDNSIASEFVGIINYCVMGLIKLKLLDKKDVRRNIPADELNTLFDECVKEVRDLMINKNTDYGEAWRDLRISSMTDLILINMLRLRQIQDAGTSGNSEGPESKYRDCVNYAIFALIQIEEKADPMM